MKTGISINSHVTARRSLPMDLPFLSTKTKTVKPVPTKDINRMQVLTVALRPILTLLKHLYYPIEDGMAVECGTELTVEGPTVAGGRVSPGELTGRRLLAYFRGVSSFHRPHGSGISDAGESEESNSERPQLFYPKFVKYG